MDEIYIFRIVFILHAYYLFNAARIKILNLKSKDFQMVGENYCFYEKGTAEF